MIAACFGTRGATPDGPNPMPCAGAGATVSLAQSGISSQAIGKNIAHESAPTMKSSNMSYPKKRLIRPISRFTRAV